MSRTRYPWFLENLFPDGCSETQLLFLYSSWLEYPSVDLDGNDNKIPQFLVDPNTLQFRPLEKLDKERIIAAFKVKT